MRSNWVFIAALAIGACAGPPAPGPDRVIEGLYAPYISHAAEKNGGEWDKAPIYSQGFKAAIDHAFEYSTLLDQPVIDFDPIANGQDFSLTNLKVETDKAPADGKAHVTAHFQNIEKPDSVGYDMVLENGAWKIDDINDAGQSLRASISDELKPIADAEALKAPVAAIYANYASGKPLPIQKQSGLSMDFARRLAAYAAKHKGAVDFEPVRGGAATTISGVKLEAASGGVIARFKADGADRVVVYDMVQDEENAPWRIADIRAPLAKPPMSASTKLDDARIK